MRFTIGECGREEWRKFRRYHYLNTDLSRSAKCFALYNDIGDSIAFLAYLHQMHPIIKNLKRVSRLVVLPDYQGIGIGTSFLETIAKHIIENGFEFDITTSAKNLILALHRKNQWVLKRVGRLSPNSDPSKRQRCNVKTATFLFRHIKK